MKKAIPQDGFLLLLILCFFEGLIVLILLMSIPADAKHSIFLGYSISRLILISGVMLIMFGFVFLIINKEKSKYKESLFGFLQSKWAFIFFLGLVTGSFIVFKGFSYKPAILTRLAPILSYFFIIGIQILSYQIFHFDKAQHYFDTLFNWLDQKHRLLYLILLSSFPLLFINAMQNQFPLGFAGLYTLMAEEIMNANFILPMAVPYYLPGGMPFAYPPLGLYLMAGFLKIGISKWIYLRFAPPIFCLLAMIPLFLLTKRISKSSFGAMVTVLMTAGSFHLYFMQVESGGVVRGLAFALGLLAIYYFDRMFVSFHWEYALISGVLLGLTGLTHLGYAYYFVFWIIAWVITHPKKTNCRGLFLVGLSSILIFLPWFVVIVLRHNITVFLNAFGSHGANQFLSIINDPNSFIANLKFNLRVIYENLWFLSLFIVGFVVLLSKKKLTLPILFILVLFIVNQGDRFVLTVSYIIIGVAADWLYRLFTIEGFILRKPVGVLGLNILVIFLIISFFFQSIKTLDAQKPLITQEMMDASDFLKNDSQTTASYLSIIADDSQADEWLPYFTQREPVLSLWGNEWVGNFHRQNEISSELVECVGSQNLDCLENFISYQTSKPEYIFMVSSLDQLANSFTAQDTWIPAYSNSKYIIYKEKLDK